ncbi:uncharacterized protein B0P05DRAFT_506198 [Gilbertella persicaria]|uniref:uncharacterized protein n=1 Tax=Gilbertella persicaria TaxID=101096 RepID=UPI00221F13FB|nr:uncharacterized protein B0P05DRAFT_506198 [Gilbertella persicaria]KAI8086820.1 hypothetical protein B0P05DRAFT_506198 [Gilbertella persicaria]
MSEQRFWTGNDGKYKVQASYVCLFQDKKVKLKKPNGSFIALPLSLLCPEDIAFIATQSPLPTRDSTQRPGILPIQNNIYSEPFESSTISTDTRETILQQERPMMRQIASLQSVRHISKDESSQMIPKQSLSSMADQFKHQTYLSTPTLTLQRLAQLPNRAIILVGSYLDVRSRFRFATVARQFYPILHKAEVWETVFFYASDHYMIDDKFLQGLIDFLERCQLQNVVKHINLDRTAITSSSFILLIKHFQYLETISIQSCWSLMTFPLAVQLIELAKQPRSIALSRVTVGKVLHRGQTHQQLDSKSFGQDIWYIHTALNKLANRNVLFDVVLCGTCHLGAASQTFRCASCGVLPLEKCIACAPRCDRCGNRSCGLSVCINPKLKIQIARCGRCEQTLALCNDERSKACQEARKPCSHCHRLYHTQCRTIDGFYISNQCTTCGTVVCPHCELKGCQGSCHGQWCQKCLLNAHLHHCKCIVLQGRSSSKSLTKKDVCNKCQKTCSQCGISHFCSRCLQLHLEKCR